MKCNVEGFERGVRIGAGLCLLLWALFDDGDTRIWGFIGIWPLATGLLRFCPAYLPFGLSSCREESGASGLSTAATNIENVQT